MPAVVTVIATAVGLAAGALISYVVARRVTHRPKLMVRVQPTLTLFPTDFDVHDRLSFSLGSRSVANICALEVEIECKGQKDIVIADAAPPRPPNATPMPRLDFTKFRVIGLRTLNNDASRFYIVLGRHGHGVYLNIHRLRAGASARFQIVGELLEGSSHFDVSQCQIFPGAIPDIDFVTNGVIARPWLKD